MFKKGGFQLYKWHSNFPVLETNDSKENCHEVTINEQNKGFSKILRLLQNKNENTLLVDCRPTRQTNITTKGRILETLARVFDSLAVVSPITLTAKLIYRKICDLKFAWDKKLSPELTKEWMLWKNTLQDLTAIPNSITVLNHIIKKIEIHGFGDASKDGCCSTIYVIVHLRNKVTQGLFTAKTLISKRGCSIPRLELISGHTVANALTTLNWHLKDTQLWRYMAGLIVQ